MESPASLEVSSDPRLEFAYRIAISNGSLLTRTLESTNTLTSEFLDKAEDFLDEASNLRSVGLNTPGEQELMSLRLDLCDKILQHLSPNSHHEYLQWQINRAEAFIYAKGDSSAASNFSQLDFSKLDELDSQAKEDLQQRQDYLKWILTKSK